MLPLAHFCVETGRSYSLNSWASMSADDGVADRRGVIRVAEKISETPPRADDNDMKEERRLYLIDHSRQLEELVRLQAVVIPALEGRSVGLETSEAALSGQILRK